MDEHEIENRDHWGGKADAYAAVAPRLWDEAPSWGTWGIPDEACPLLPEDCTGLDVIELGCGTAYVSGWAAGRGASRVVGVDVTPAQLATARRMADERGVALELVEASAEAVPLPDASFDLAVSEYGASLWCEPDAWLAEAARLLRPGGRLAFLTVHPLATLTAPLDGSIPSGTELLRDWFGDHRYDWRDAVDEPGGIEFVPTPGAWFRALDAAGFDVTDYRELRAPADATGTPAAVTAEWARRFPSEHAFWARRRG
ncbi:MAG: class I SAM-dependent methyltransferase [Actinomycetes bacterium]